MGGDKETKKEGAYEEKKPLKTQEKGERNNRTTVRKNRDTKKMIEVKHPKKRNKGKSACAHGLKVGVVELESPRYSGSKTQAKFKDNDT